MKKKQGADAREKEHRRHLLVWKFAAPAIGMWIRRKIGYSHSDFEPADIEGPVIVAINHACAYDPLLVTDAFRRRPLTFIASEHLVRMKPWGPAIQWMVSLIPHSKGGRSSRTALVTMKRIKRGESVFIAAEGEQSWNGIPSPVMPYTGKMIKGSGATLITYRIEGAYLAYPRWARHPRKGKVYGHPVNIYSPEQIKSMSDNEIEEAVASDLRFNVWEWQENQPGGPVNFRCSKGGNAEGLERAVFSCPECGRTDSLETKGDYISCSCGFRLRLCDTGWFSENSHFSNIAGWEDFDRRNLTQKMQTAITGTSENSGDPVRLFEDCNITLRQVNSDHTDELICTGRLVLLCGNGSAWMQIGDKRFDLLSLSGMTMVLSNRVVMSDKSGYYELTTDNANLRKYIIAREIMTDLSEKGE